MIRKVALVTGSTGFIGTNLIKKLLERNYYVTGVDNFSSSEKWKSGVFESNNNYEFFEYDITENLNSILSQSKFISEQKRIDEIYNLACPASPPRYLKLPFETIKVSTQGVFNILEIAKKYNSKILHASTSEIYGDPLEHPQKETYRGNVNTIGPRSCYDEGKRISETICYEFNKEFNIDVRVIRIFNTYGPFMDPNDGRVITNFINQALKNEDITIYGNGSQTRSFQYIDDLIKGIEKMMNLEQPTFGPINMGNPEEFTIKELAELILQLIQTKSKMVYKDLPKDDPMQRRPDITEARNILNWGPKINLQEGLAKTIEYYKSKIS